ncbi:J domain-containing protein [Entomospira nematocerorum]|uniref:J domain-containing protein n=1 Tax=Entomospira nematocerorum TaxID=2719987 RepID=A0A968GBC7_9SPIO|nr:J domain-containing protein [Entomospira nematocera]NIZ46730.1 J domain-containing protein [Entomospira nematocera]WDI33474.1 J domain-containing protein [Entomospira nematocera]
MMQNNLTHYEILGVSSTATIEEIRSAYKKLALQYHPDRLNDLPGEERERLTEKMKQVTNAYSTLKDEGSRKRYDEELYARRYFQQDSSSFSQHSYQHFRSKEDMRRNYGFSSGPVVVNPLVFFGVIAVILALVLVFISVAWPFLLVLFLLSLVRSLTRRR